MFPFLSIIIPVYKVEPYLRECLDSIAVSPLDCWEAILVDDGSPDRCSQICDEYVAKDSRFHVIHQENEGVAAARNAGLNAARGEWCWFVDSDDVVDMQHVGELVAWLKVRQEIDLVVFDLESFKDGDKIIKKSQSFQIVDDDLSKSDFLMKYVCYHHQRLWYHRRGWGKDHHQRAALHQHALRFTRGIRLAEDLEFQYKYLTLCHHSVKVDSILYYYRLRETSSTGDMNYRKRVVEDLPIVLKNLACWTKENDMQPEPWYDYRIMKLLQNMLYSASFVPHIDSKKFQITVRDLLLRYRTLKFPFVRNFKIRIADFNVNWYFFFNKFYLKVKGIV